MTIMIIVYKMVVFLMVYCTAQCHSVVFCLYFVYCMIVLIVDNLFFFTWAASQWAVRLLWQPSDCMAIFVIFCLVLLSENKYDDDEDFSPIRTQALVDAY